MAPEVVSRKLDFLRMTLADFRRFSGSSLEQVLAEHYQVERLFELLVTAAADLIQHLLAERKVAAASYKDAFARAGRLGILPADLAVRLQDAARMRNVIVHLYEDIDYEKVRDSIDPALADIAALIAAIEDKLPASDE